MSAGQYHGPGCPDCGGPAHSGPDLVDRAARALTRAARWLRERRWLGGGTHGREVGRQTEPGPVRIAACDNPKCILVGIPTETAPGAVHVRCDHCWVPLVEVRQ